MDIDGTSTGVGAHPGGCPPRGSHGCPAAPSPQEVVSAPSADSPSVGGADQLVGLEGHVRVRAERLGRVPERVARWRDAGAGAVAINPLRAGGRWPDEHLDLLLQAAETLK